MAVFIGSARRQGVSSGYPYPLSSQIPPAPAPASTLCIPHDTLQHLFFTRSQTPAFLSRPDMFPPSTLLGSFQRLAFPLMSIPMYGLMLLFHLGFQFVYISHSLTVVGLSHFSFSDLCIFYKSDPSPTSRYFQLDLWIDIYIP